MVAQVCQSCPLLGSSTTGLECCAPTYLKSNNSLLQNAVRVIGARSSRWLDLAASCGPSMRPVRSMLMHWGVEGVKYWR